VPPNSSIPPKFIIGVCLVLMGVVLALDQLGVLQANHLLRFWPAALIIVGLAMLQRGERHSALRALVLIVVGGWLLLNTLGLVSLDLWEFILPLLRIPRSARHGPRKRRPPDRSGTEWFQFRGAKFRRTGACIALFATERQQTPLGQIRFPRRRDDGIHGRM
jgi:hypothetical protein